MPCTSLSGTRPHRPRADHRCRNRRTGRPRRLLRQGRRAARHGAEPHAAAALPRCHGSPSSMAPMPCATRSSRSALAEAASPAAMSSQSPCAASIEPGASAPRPGKELPTSLGSGVSSTETFVAIKAEIGNWRWAGVPFYIRTGKRLASRVSEIVISSSSRSRIRSSTMQRGVSANQLVIRLQPDEGVKQSLMIKDPGPGGMRLRRPLDMSFAESLRRAQSGCLRTPADGRHPRQPDAVHASRRGRGGLGSGSIRSCRAGIHRPRRAIRPAPGVRPAIALIERDGRTWHEDGH
jgi:glucose-6-phosphate 1-dehydrogenase